MLDIGIQELLVIMVLALIIFGPDKLPELGRRLGRAMREFRRASDEFRSTVEQNLQINADHDISPPTTPPLETQTSAVASAAPASDSGVDGAGIGTPSQDGAASGIGTPEGQPDEDLQEPYWTSRGGRLLHRRDCAWRRRIAASERIPVKTVGEGWDQGLQPCPACDPKEAAVAS